MAGVQSTMTDATGTYRFPALPPGRYEVTATLQGFQPAKTSDVRLELGQVLKIDLILIVEAISETVKVTAESPLIDVKQNAAGGNVQAEIIERIPKGRDFAGLLTSVPAVTNEARNSGIQIDGASGADNLPDRRRRHDEPSQRDLRKDARAGLREGGAGEGERLQCRVPRIARRRD
jgi:Carboxypeptidase regulatory-like domain